MTFMEKAMIVLLSVSLSVLANLLYRFLNDYRSRLFLRKEFNLLLTNLEAALCNLDQDAILCNSSIVNLVRNYYMIQKDKTLHDDFLRIIDIYNFHRAGGYIEDRRRLEDDLSEIRHMKQLKR